MHRRHENRVMARTGIVRLLQCDRFVDYGANAVAHVTAQTERVEAVFFVDQNGHAHIGVVDGREPLVERARRAGRNAGNVVTHLARHIAGGEERRARGRPIGAQLGEGQCVIGAVADAQPAPDTGGEERLLAQSARRPDRGGGQGPRIARQPDESRARQRTSRDPTRRIHKETAAVEAFGMCRGGGHGVASAS